MDPTFTKVDDTTIKKTQEVEIKAGEKTYNIDFLKQQEIAIIRQRDDFVAAREVELKEVQELIAKCEELGIGHPIKEEPILDTDPVIEIDPKVIPK